MFQSFFTFSQELAMALLACKIRTLKKIMAKMTPSQMMDLPTGSLRERTDKTLED